MVVRVALHQPAAGGQTPLQETVVHRDSNQLSVAVPAAFQPDPLVPTLRVRAAEGDFTQIIFVGAKPNYITDPCPEVSQECRTVGLDVVPSEQDVLEKWRVLENCPERGGRIETSAASSRMASLSAAQALRFPHEPLGQKALARPLPAQPL
jgi:hypothetical protein